MDPRAVRDYYKGKSILITGGTGFMGKVLLEKLLRSCPEIKAIYVMARSKKAKCPSSRMQEISKLPLFEPLLKQDPNAFSKVIPITGDLTKNNLGMRWDCRDDVIDQVQIIFHLGASLRLEADLKDHVSSNLAGTKRVLELAQKMKNLESFVHVSTVFCQCEPPVVEEKIFQPKVSPQAVMDLTEWLSKKENHREITENIVISKCEELLGQQFYPMSMVVDFEIGIHNMKRIRAKCRPYPEEEIDKLLGEHPNCYTLTKQLAEALVDEYKDSLPVTVVRPAIVTPTHHDPLPGWVDNLNGPIGILVAGGKGVLRSMMCGRDNKSQMVPCDVAINCIILAAWKRGTMGETKETPVYNVSSGDEVPLTYGTIMDKGKEALAKYPVDPGLWYPGGTITTNKYVHETKVFFLQIIPALFIDMLLFIFGQKTFMMRVQKKIQNGCEVLKYFTMRTWNVNVDKTLSLHDRLSKEEQEIFFLANVDTIIEELMKDCILGTKVYCLKEPLDTLPSARKKLIAYWIVDKLFKAFMLYQSAILLFNFYFWILQFDAETFNLSTVTHK